MIHREIAVQSMGSCAHGSMALSVFILLLLTLQPLGLAAAEFHVNIDGSAEFTRVQDGIDAGEPGDVIYVHPGTYIENLEFNGKDLVVTSIDPLDLAVITSTIIDGNLGGPVVQFDGSETDECIIQGLTIRNGSAEFGGGISGAIEKVGPFTMATVRGCIIIMNAASDGGGIAKSGGSIDGCIIGGNFAEEDGGGVFDCTGSITDSVISCNIALKRGGGIFDFEGSMFGNTIESNTAGKDGGGGAYCRGTMRYCVVNANSSPNGDGGGLYASNCIISDCAFRRNFAAHGGGASFCNGEFHRCVIEGNVAKYSGGGLHRCSEMVKCAIICNSSILGGGLESCPGDLVECTVWGNFADEHGGGLYSCFCDITSSIICSNTAAFGSGGGLCSCDGQIRNCLVLENAAKTFGGGLAYCDGDISCCTIIENEISGDNTPHGTGGGLYSCKGEVSNCIVWYNRAEYSPNVSAYQSSPTYCCIEGWKADLGRNIISGNPCFAPGPYGDFYLSNIEAGQATNSPCIGAGAGSSSDYGLEGLTTSTDGTPDVGRTDIGYHYPPVEMNMACSLNWNRFGPGDSIIGYVSSSNGERPIFVDAFAVLISPDGDLYSLGEGGFARGMQFWLTNLYVPGDFTCTDGDVFELTIPDGAPSGQYLFAVYVYPAFIHSRVLAASTPFWVNSQ